MKILPQPLQEERGLPEQEVVIGSVRAARGPGQPAGNAFSPIAAPPKNPQPTMGVKHKNDSKLPTEDVVSLGFHIIAPTSPIKPSTSISIPCRVAFDRPVGSVRLGKLHLAFSTTELFRSNTCRHGGAPRRKNLPAYGQCVSCTKMSATPFFRIASGDQSIPGPCVSAATCGAICPKEEL